MQDSRQDLLFLQQCPTSNTIDNSVFDNTEDFVEAMLTSTAPTMLMYGGNYLRGHEINLEDMFPIQFPFGSGGPTLGKKEKS